MALPTQTFGDGFGPADFTASNSTIDALIAPWFPSATADATLGPTTLLFIDPATGYRQSLYGTFIIVDGLIQPAGSTVTGFRLSTPADVLLVQWVDMLPIPIGTFISTDINPVNISPAFVGVDQAFASFGTIYNDILYGRNGADVLDGGLGNDLIRGFGANDTIDGGQGNDTLFGELGSDLLRGGDGDDSMLGGDADDSLLGGAGNDRMFGEDGNDTLDGGDGDDSVDGWLANDLLRGGAGQDTLRGGDGNDLLQGGDGSDLLSGQYGFDIVEGGSGSDTLDGSDQPQSMVVNPDQKFDFLYGGAGDDIYLIQNDNGWGAVGAIDRGAEAPGERIALRQSGGTGVISVNAGTFSGTLLDQNSDGTYDGVGIAAVRTFPFGGDTSTWQFFFSTLRLGQPIAAGNYSAATRFGQEDPGTAGMIVSFGTPPAGAVSGAFSIFALEASGTNVTKFGATFEQLLPTASLPVTIRGMVAFGIDPGTIDNLVGEKPGEGFDLVQSSVGYTLPANVEALTLIGTDPTNGTGNWQDNALTGNAGANRLRGLDGNDTLDGGIGADTLEGGAGNDVFHVDSASDVVIESASGGTDTVIASVSYALAGGANGEIENLILTGNAVDATGNEYANTIVGTAANNTIRGGSGFDTLGGGDGNDTIYGDAGEDRLYGERGDDVLLGGDDYDLIFGGEGNDLIVGEGSGDIVFGQSGNDLIDGGVGTDVLFGQEGNDIIFGDAADDQIIGDEGNDIIMGERGGFTLTGGNDIIYGDTEFLSLIGGNDQLDGDGGDDYIIGGGGNDVIDGDNGNDLIEGNAGADTLVGSDASVAGAATTGSDLFIYRAMTDAGDTIYGFDIRPGDNDGIDLRPLFDALGYAGTTPRADGYLSISQSGANVLVGIDADGSTNGANFTTMITLVDRTAGTISDNYFLFQ